LHVHESFQEHLQGAGRLLSEKPLKDRLPTVENCAFAV
jgi:hypothetical protein